MTPPDPFSIHLQRNRLRRPENKAATAGKAEYKIQHSPFSFILFHLLSESAEPPAVAGEHLSRVKFIPEENTREKVYNVEVKQILVSLHRVHIFSDALFCGSVIS